MSQKRIGKSYFSGQPGLYWENAVLDTGEDAFFMKVNYQRKPVCIAKRLMPPNGATEWVVYANGGVVGATESWAEAEVLACTTLTLMEAAHASS